MAGVCFIDSQGNVVAMNPAGSHILGWGAQIPVGEPCHALLRCEIPISNSEEMMCPLQGLLQEKKNVLGSSGQIPWSSSAMVLGGAEGHRVR